MDIDISDILADVSRPSYRGTHTSISSQAQQPYDVNSSAYTDHQLLVRAWTSERTSPSLLPYPSALVARVLTRIRDQITRIEDMTSTADMSDMAYTTTRGKPAHNPQNTNLILSILQTDLSRTQFILRSYLRQRLHKITKYAVYWLKHHVPQQSSSSSSLLAQDDPSTEPDAHQQLLSSAEITFLKNHQALLSDFYDSSFLSGFPPNLRGLDDSAGGINMIEGPDGAVPVIVRCLVEGWDNVKEVDSTDNHGNTQQASNTAEGAMADVELRMRRGEVWVVRWRDVRSGVVRGDLELL